MSVNCHGSVFLRGACNFIHDDTFEMAENVR